MASILGISWILTFCVYMLTASVIPAEHRPQDPMQDKDHIAGEKHDPKYDHEQFLGRDEANQYDELTPEQSKERLAKLITIIDKDNDGQITEDELKNHIDFMQKRYVQNDVERTWTNYETEKLKDGKLTWEHYREVVYGPSEPGAEVTQEYAEMADRDKKRFTAADQTGDGMLDRGEYGCYMHPEDCPHMRDVVVEETMGDIDKNKDGVISMDEYIGDMYRPEDYPELNGKEPEWVEAERAMFHDQRDKDKDGSLNREEMAEWIMPTNFDHADAEAKHLLHMADEDKDGTLSKDEILLHYDTFVGSQATDYGEALQKHDPTEL